MSSPEQRQRREEWNRLKAYCRQEEAGPLIMESSVSTCLCDAVPWADRLRMLGRYLLVSLAHHIPASGGKIALLRLAGVKIGRDVYISPGVVIDPLFPELITLEDGALLGLGCRLLTHEYTARVFRLGRVRIGQGAVIGAWATVRSGVTVDAMATVGACSFVNRDVAGGTTVGGVPARVLAESEVGA